MEGKNCVVAWGERVNKSTEGEKRRGEEGREPPAPAEGSLAGTGGSVTGPKMKKGSPKKGLLNQKSTIGRII